MTETKTFRLGLVICIVATACGNPPGQNDKNQTCTCLEYPFPAECASVCKLSEAVVQSVNQNSIVVKVPGPNSAQPPEERTIPISAMQPGQIQDLRPGSKVQVLSKVENGKPVIKSLHLVGKPPSR